MAAPSILRLSLGRAATADERLMFNDGFTAPGANMPPLLYGLLGVPDGRTALLRSAQIAWHQNRATLSGGKPTQFSELDGNIYAVWTGPKLSFLHIEKCGGCALLSWLAGRFHPEQIDADPYRDLPPHLFARLTNAGAERPMIWGHYDMPTLRRLDPGRAIFTVLREPRARLASLYQFWRSVDPAKFDAEISFAVGAAHRLSLEAFLEQDDPYVTDLIDNIYVRRLTGLYATGADEDPLRAAPEAALSAAVAALKQLFYVGVTEEMDRGAAGLGTRLGLAPPAQSLLRNVTDENHRDRSGWFRKIGRGQLSAAAQAALDRRTVLDRQLYAVARRGLETGE